ncbi:MAG: poly-gamma-glutamate synthase PgsB [Candidatus Marinimicrobia bacterium]|nr:poly-gamma-glutamate synthase PgsB [Candidatus Neomarinimicrobiota bacterium]MBT6869854.1 poly-gamma-glutamate synthase PgsB [Candidatus Neomarinimicrobiota bacterium]MBT7377672.1 poly-gamma-glutamate synthase PgsB [Candidatus Neomarinimicrobiota bacterium]
MIEATLIILILTLLVLGGIEYYNHTFVLSQLPIRIHVNGARGKSSVTRLIAAGLREGGLKTMAKTTGSAPRIINEFGKDLIIHRLRSASIGEQVKLLRSFANKKPDAVVIECMAVQPQYQWVAEQKMIQSTVSVITNVRPDHLDEMGSTMEDIALSLSNTIPFNGTLVTAEKDVLEPLERVAKSRNSNVDVVDANTISEDYMDKFPFLEHAENVALALQVCKDVGVSEDLALSGMLKTNPDPGALVIWNLDFKGTLHHFVNAFAANDPKSTLQIWNMLEHRMVDNSTCIFLNTRSDRRYRTNQLMNLVCNEIQPDLFIIRGDDLPKELHELIDKHERMEVKLFPEKASPSQLFEYFASIESQFIMGIGNIVGWGENFVSDLKEFRI